MTDQRRFAKGHSGPGYSANFGHDFATGDWLYNYSLKATKPELNQAEMERLFDTVTAEVIKMFQFYHMKIAQELKDAGL